MISLIDASFRCSCCGEPEDVDTLWDGEIGQKMLDRQLCFTCLFWTELAEKANSPYSIRIKGEHYFACDENSPIKGYGGCRLKIEFIDGRRLESSNLWSQGTIPERFREVLPNNARFVPYGQS